MPPATGNWAVRAGVVAQAWHRLAGLLDVHTAAEAEIWHPAVCRVELPAAAGPQEAIADRDGIRAGLQEVWRHDIWSVVTVLLRVQRASRWPGAARPR